MKNANRNEALKLLDTRKYNNLPELRPVPTTEAEIDSILMSQKSEIPQGMMAFLIEC
jgi:hypothetical protein